LNSDLLMMRESSRGQVTKSRVGTLVAGGPPKRPRRALLTSRSSAAGNIHAARHLPARPTSNFPVICLSRTNLFEIIFRLLWNFQILPERNWRFNDIHL